MDTKNTHLVAVYGSLRSGLGNSGFLQGSKFIKYLRLKGFEMFDNNGYYPYVFYTGNPDERILVEVYEVDNEAMRALDGLEGISAKNDDSGHYKRRLLGTSGIWIYIATGKPDTTLPKVPHISDMLDGDGADKYNFADWSTYLDHRDSIVDEDEYDSWGSSYSTAPSASTPTATITRPVTVNKDEIEYPSLSYEELAKKYAKRVAKYANYSLDDLRQELIDLGKHFELSRNKTLIIHYYNLIQLTGMTIKNKSIEEEVSTDREGDFSKFLNSIHMKELRNINPELFSEIEDSIKDGEFDRYYATLIEFYQDTDEGAYKKEIGECLALIDKGLSAQASLQAIQTNIRGMLGESANLFMENIKYENHRVLSALLEEVQKAP